jgi:hypothetical protein
MVAMLDGTDPLKGDTRVFDNEAYAEDKIRALGKGDLPKSLWDLTKHRNVGRQFKQRLSEPSRYDASTISARSRHRWAGDLADASRPSRRDIKATGSLHCGNVAILEDLCVPTT